MKLKQVQVTNYRCILDSGEVDINQTTCLVGKNEAGKTAFLSALEGLRAVKNSDAKYSKIEDYPRRNLSEYDNQHPDGEARVVLTKWELDDDDLDNLNKEFGENVVNNNVVTISKRYESKISEWSAVIDQQTVLKNLVQRFALRDEDVEPLAGIVTTKDAAQALGEIPERNKRQSEMLNAINQYENSDATQTAIKILNKNTPKFLYFSHYDRMSGAISIDKINQDRANGKINEGDQVFLDFLEYAGTKLDDLVNTTKFEELNAKCEAAANRITDQIFEYWTQNDQLSIEVRLDEGKPDDIPPFNRGTVARARVKNNIHRVTVPFSERSAGFIWFFSFLVKFAQIKKQKSDVIILLDEPGLTLHGTAQKDLLKYFKEQLEPNHQLIYSTHSPFMVPADNLASVRTVEDVVRRVKCSNRQISEGTKIRHDVLTTDPQTNFPIFGAMGFEVTQGLIIAPNTLLVEGISDIIYLQVASQRLKSLNRVHLDDRWAICPSGGIDKILPFVRLFFANNLNIVVLTDFFRGQKQKLERLYQAELLEKERIILATDIVGKNEADIEDFFDTSFYVELLNNTYELTGQYKLDVEKLESANPDTPRLVKKAEAYFNQLPTTYRNFGHIDPAMHLLKNPVMLEAENGTIEKTLERFEKSFKLISKYVDENSS